MSYPFISHHGAVQGVTGSCHQLHLDPAQSLLVDCGLHLGLDARSADSSRIDFPTAGITALLVTHVHLDHVGRIPDLIAAGYRGPILCSEPSALLLPLVLEDALKVEGGREPNVIDQYLRHIRNVIVPIPFGQWHSLILDDELTCRVRLQRAGHLLGSAYVECDVSYPLQSRDQRVVFSGDVGASPNPLLREPCSPERADILVLESTYGDRLHADRSTRQQRLEQVIDRALADQGTVLIPAFSIGRTQELLFEIEDILHRKSLLLGETDEDGAQEAFSPIDWPQLPVILDSPLANRFTQAYRDMNQYWNDSAQQRLAGHRNPLKFKQLISIESHQQHQQVVNYLKSTGRPAIVIASNGMCSGGRIVNYLKAMLGDPRHEIVFTGYQAKGTPGAVIQASEGAEGFVKIDLDGEMYEIKAKIATVGGYSAHADQAGLVDFVMGMSELPGRVVLVHGEDRAKRSLAAKLEFHGRERGVELEVVVPA
ncbi:MBL fold metallo-hydrolase [Pseudomonas sp. S25]|uniref:MBL fold metallo-hydrolase n=1 Tax=Pseudomonas maioricensis TaxID=1766623 RepID=A0ABS9ZIW5_9PSED|nr:MBL fold metallo-hydrolase [Pseudomonas sp. S25]